MIKSITVSLALLAALPANAGTHLDRSAEQVLKNYNIQVPLSELSEHQKNSIVLIAHQGDGGSKRAAIISVLGQGLFSNIFRR